MQAGLRLIPRKSTEQKERSPRKAAATAPAPAVPTDKRLVINRWQELKRRLQEVEVRITAEAGVDRAELELLEQQMEGWFTGLNPEFPAVEETDLGYLQVTAKEFKREFSPAAKRAVYQALVNLKEPLDAFELTQEKVKAHLGLKFLESVVTKDRTGARRMKWVPKGSLPTAA